MTYHIWALLMTIIYDYHLWLSHMSITHDHHLWLWSYYSWLCSSLMDITYEHQVLCLMAYTLWLITCEYHTRLLPMTIIHDYEHLRWLCLSHDLPQLTMTITHEHDCHPWLWISLTTYHHPWLAHITHGRSHHPWLVHITRDYHLCVLSMTVTDVLSPMTLITHDHHSWPSPMTITQDYHQWLWLPFTARDYDFLLLTDTYVLSPMSSLSCFVSHVYDLWLMTIMTYDYDSSLVTITSDHHPWPWLMIIRSDHLTSHPWPWPS